MKKNIFLFIVLALCFGFFQEGQAYSNGRILEMSKTGQILVFDLGTIDGINESDIGLFYLREKKKILTPLGKAEAIKVFPRTSIWYLRNAYDQDRLLVGQEVSLASQKEQLRGRMPLKVVENKVVFSPTEESLDSLKFNLENEDTPKLEKRSEKFSQTVLYLETDRVDHPDIAKATHIKNWEKDKTVYVPSQKKNVDFLISGNPGENVTTQSIKSRYDQKRAENISNGTMVAVNNGEKDEEELFEKTDESYTFLKANLTAFNSTDEAKAKKAEQEMIQASGEKIMNEAPGTWSESLSDEELQDFIVRYGVEFEKNRHQIAEKKRLTHEVFLQFGLRLNENYRKDLEKQSGTTFAYDVGYEYYLGRMSTALDSWAIPLGLRWSAANYLVGDINAYLEEKSAKLATNYYWLNKPYQLERLLSYIGLGVRYGQAKAQSNYFDDVYSYKMTSFPTIDFGLKYRFKDYGAKIEYGLHSNLNIEKTNYELNDGDIAIVNESQSFTNIKILAGLSLYF